MMWVKLTLPPRARRRWLLMTTRLSAINFAGTARTLVAVGTASEASMFATTREAAPRSGAAVEAATSSLGSSFDVSLVVVPFFAVLCVDLGLAGASSVFLASALASVVADGVVSG